MEEWKDLKNPLIGIKNSFKDLFKGIFSISKNKFNNLAKANPMKAVGLSCGFTFFVMFLFAGFWFVKYTVVVKNQDSTSYVESKAIDSAKISIEAKAREDMREIYEEKIDSLEDALIDAKALKQPSNGFKKHRMNNLSRKIKERSTDEKKPIQQEENFNDIIEE